MLNYVKLKNKGMKSTANQTHIISVKVVAFYDNGLTGYDYNVGNDGDYNYMIFQNNLVPNEEGKYVSFTKADTIAVWSPDNDIAKGYYTYKKVGRGFDYTSILRRKTKSMNYALTGSGYSSNYGILNPKMVSADTMTTDNNKFSFNSITPKIKVEKTTSLINGAAINLSLSGADLEDFCEEGDESGSCTNNANSEFYLYIDVWNASIYAQNNDMYYTLRPKAKVKINKDNPSESVRIMVDGLSANGLYFYNVYAYLNKNGHPKYTQLFDYSFENEYKVKIYNFMSLSSSDLYHSYAVSFRPNLEQGSGYSDKLMDTTINLVSYANNIPFNFDLGYAFCHNDDYTCGISENSTSIFKNIIDGSKVKAVTTDTFDISDETISSEIEFGTDYFMRVVAVYDQYERDPDTRQYVLKKTNLPLNGSQLRVSLRKLLMPKFVVEREAVYIPGENGAPGKYAIDFTINVDDPDRVLDDGKYYVALKDSSGNIVGDLQVLDDGNYSTVATADECGSYVPISSFGECQKYSFDALVSEKQVRITGLTADTRYTIEVSNKAYVNNYNENIPVSERYFDAGESFPVYSTNDAGVAFGKELIYSATAKTFVVTFMGGSNFDNVREVGYTVARWGQDASGDFTYSGCYNIGDSTNNPECQNNKHFEQFEDTGYWKFVIDDERINNQIGETYYIALSFVVVNADNDYIHYYGDDESRPITNNPITNPEFFGRAQYVKENTQP